MNRQTDLSSLAGTAAFACMPGSSNDFEAATTADLEAVKLRETMSFMLETRFPRPLTEDAASEAPLQDDHVDCWSGLEKKFDGTPGLT